MRLLPLLLFIIPALGGCLDAGGIGELFDGAELEPVARTWHLDSEGLATAALPADGTVPLGWSWGEWFAGIAPPRWEGPDLGDPYVITEATITIVYEAVVPLVDNGLRPGFTIWFGSGDSVVEHAFAPGPQVWAAGGVIPVEFEVDDLPLGGLVVEPGAPPIVQVGTYYPDGMGSDNVLIHIGTDGSHMDLTTQQVDLPEATATALEPVSIDLAGGRCAVDMAPSGAPMAEIPIEVGPDHVGLDILVEHASGGDAVPDVDFLLLDGDGARVMHAGGPASPEAVHLRAPNMAAAAPGTWTLEVYNCQPQVASYTVSVTLLS